MAPLNKVNGTVQQGAKRGRKLGFPTANIAVVAGTELPAKGVYACWVWVDGADKRYEGVLNIGVRPTFGEEAVVYETHIFDYNGDLYGKEIRVELVEYLRQEQAFKTVHALKNQISLDISAAKAVLNKK